MGHLRIVNMVPLRGQPSPRKIAGKTGLSEFMLRRLLRHTTTMHVFREPEPGVLAHDKNSKPDINDWLKIASQDLWPTATRLGRYLLAPRLFLTPARLAAIRGPAKVARFPGDKSDGRLRSWNTALPWIEEVPQLPVPH